MQHNGIFADSTVLTTEAMPQATAPQQAMPQTPVTPICSNLPHSIVNLRLSTLRAVDRNGDIDPVILVRLHDGEHVLQITESRGTKRIEGGTDGLLGLCARNSGK